MISNYLKLLISIIICFSFIYSTNWENLTSTLNITDIFIKNNTIYASTIGGVVIIDNNTQDLSILDFDNNIYPLDLSSIYIDSNLNRIYPIEDLLAIR